MPHWNNQPWQRNLSKIASGKPGAVQVVFINAVTTGNHQCLVGFEPGSQPSLGSGAGMMGHTPFLAIHVGRTAKKEVHQEDRRDHGALSFRCVVGWALVVALATKARSIVARFGTIDLAMRRTKRSQKATPKANNAKTATVSAWPITGEIAS